MENKGLFSPSVGEGVDLIMFNLSLKDPQKEKFTKVRLLKEFSKVAMTNPCRGKFNRVTIFLC